MTTVFKRLITIMTFIFFVLVQAQDVSASVNITMYNNSSVPVNASLPTEENTKSTISPLGPEDTLITNENSDINIETEADTAVTSVVEPTIESSVDSTVANSNLTSGPVTLSQSIPSVLTSLANNLGDEDYSMSWETYNATAPYERAQIILNTFLTERSRFENFTNVLTLSEDQTALQDFGNDVDYKSYYWAVINDFVIELYNDQGYYSFLIQDADLGLIYLVEYIETANSTSDDIVLDVNIVEYQYSF